MLVELQQKTPKGVHWSQVTVGRTYQNVGTPEMVVIAFWEEHATSVHDAKMALPIHNAHGGKLFKSFRPADSSRWVELDVQVKIHGEI
ncbi:MAG: hypothetical protein DI616_15760 [Paracoccus denitrificans]|uniref:Uncharacterized protein n=1 Tax=Paracoccus denitrificans TaxID=266 RepID=A0A533I5U8_PARDE|nr:MAG: hypothetical protein DI616_15760 [Paracoccus denitrificans]